MLATTKMTVSRDYKIGDIDKRMYSAFLEPHGPNIYGGLFNPISYEPFCTYYPFKAFGEMYKLGTQAASVTDGTDLYCVAAMDGDRHAAMISNLGDECEITTNLCSCMKAYLIDVDHFMTEIELNPKKFTLGKNQVVYFKNF